MRLRRWMILGGLLLAAPFLGGCGESSSPAASTGAPQVQASAPATEPAPCCEPDAPATRPAATTRPSAPRGVRVSAWLAPGERDVYSLDFGVTDQDGQALRLKDLRGRPMAVSFIFTNCPNPNMCPLTAALMADLQHKAEQAGLGGKVRLVLITYDPVRDTPAKLKEFAQHHGLRSGDALLLRPDGDDFASLLAELQVRVAYAPDGTINHTTDLILIDRKGRFVRDYQGGPWDNQAALEDLHKLVAEED